jgi:hypothetical protein
VRRRTALAGKLFGAMGEEQDQRLDEPPRPLTNGRVAFRTRRTGSASARHGKRDETTGTG